MTSAAKFAKPGRPIAANAPRPNASPAKGMTLPRPPKSSRTNVPVRLRSSPAMANNNAIERPWANIKATRFNWNALIKQNQTDQQNEASNREIDRDLPGSRGPISAAPDSDQ